MRRADMVVSGGVLRFAGRRFACTLGRGGRTADKREGDGATPVGAHDIVGVLYRADRMARPVRRAVPIGPFDLWSDDPAHEDYNRMIRAPCPHGHERLRRADPMYDLILITDWNWPRPVRGRGSAIFVHAWRRPGHPTAGCVGLARGDLRWIVARLRTGARLVVR